MFYRVILLSTLFIFFLAGTEGICHVPEKHIVVVIPSYNNIEWYKQNLMTLLSQEYKNYSVIYIDDCSTDGTGKNVEKYAKKLNAENKFTLQRNTRRCGALENLFNTIHACHDDDIIAIYDGDDWFPDSKVLSTINEAYQSENIWLTYGTYIGYPDGKTSGHSKPFSHEVVDKNLFRTKTHPSHLRTFYAWLFKKIAIEDLLWEGEFMPVTSDLAIMFPMIEMAGERHKFIEKITYVYNQSNPISDWKLKAELQKKIDHYIRSLPPYPRLKNKDDDPIFYR